MLDRLARMLDHALAVFLSVLLLVMVLGVSWQVVSRYLLNDPSGWTEELARFLLIWIGLFGGAFAYHRRLHLGLDLLAERLQAGRNASRSEPSGNGIANMVPRRDTHWHRRLIDSCVLVFAVSVLIVGGSSLVALTNELEQFSPALGLPMAIVYLSLPASGMLMALSAVLALIRPHEGKPHEADTAHVA